MYLLHILNYFQTVTMVLGKSLQQLTSHRYNSLLHVLPISIGSQPRKVIFKTHLLIVLTTLRHRCTIHYGIVTI